MKDDTLKSKNMYKITLILLKTLPIIMVGAYFLMLLCFKYLPYYIIIPHLLGTVAAPLAFIYITSYVFRFCEYHRIFIHYYAFISILNVSHHYFANVFNPIIVDYIHHTGTIIFIIVASIMYFLKYKKDKCLDKIDECKESCGVI